MKYKIKTGAQDNLMEKVERFTWFLILAADLVIVTYFVKLWFMI